MARLVVREARADLGLLLCVAALLALIAGLAAAGPPLLEESAARALRQRVAQAQGHGDLLTASARLYPPDPQALEHRPPAQQFADSGAWVRASTNQVLKRALRTAGLSVRSAATGSASSSSRSASSRSSARRRT